MEIIKKISDEKMKNISGGLGTLLLSKIQAEYPEIDTSSFTIIGAPTIGSEVPYPYIPK